AETFDHRQGELALLDVLATRFQIPLEAAQVEYVVDDLEGEPDRFEELSDAVDLHFGSAPQNGADARGHPRRHRRLEAVDGENATLELAHVSRFQRFGDELGKAVDVDRLAGMARAHAV